jgi:hypothetical protein
LNLKVVAHVEAHCTKADDSNSKAALRNEHNNFLHNKKMMMCALRLVTLVAFALRSTCCGTTPYLRRQREAVDDLATPMKHLSAFYGEADNSDWKWRADWMFSLSMEYDESPTAAPSTTGPTYAMTLRPSPLSPVPSEHSPTLHPTLSTAIPTKVPTYIPTTLMPSQATIPPSTRVPTKEPSVEPTTLNPSFAPTNAPSASTPAPSTVVPKPMPTVPPVTSSPTLGPTGEPTATSPINPTFSPSSAPSADLGSSRGECDDNQEREAELHLTLSLISSDLDDPASPAGKAWWWILNEDGWGICEASDPTLVQRFVLALVYFAMGGDSWVSPDSDTPFLSPVSECEWTGIHCNVAGFVRNVELGTLFSLCDGLHNAMLSITSNISFFSCADGRNLSGSIPSEIAFISTLRVLGMKDNQIVGAIPESLNALHPFLVLRVQNNQLGGTIPSDLSPSLVRLLVQDNLLTGQLPPAMNNMTKLRILQVQNNAITGEIPPGLAFATDLGTYC